MADAVKTLKQFKKADKLTRLVMRKNGPRSFNRGVGAVLLVLEGAEGEATRDELIERLGWSRRNLKNIVKKAQKKGFVEIADAQGKGYSVKLTEEGKEVIGKREAANKAAAEKILSCLSEEEVEQLNAITEKLIVAAKAEKVCAYGKTRKSRKCCKARKTRKCGKKA